MSTEMFLSDRDLKRIFGPSFDELLKKTHSLHLYTDRKRRGNNDYLLCSRHEFANAVVAYHQYYEQKNGQNIYPNTPLRINGGHGIIPEKIFSEMRKEPWWQEINSRLKEIKTKYKEDDLLTKIVKPFVMPTTPSFYRHRDSRRVTRY